ncbi:MAG: DUF4860 domain-containing protein [Thomasclavelia sp.]|uniref:DUF4860 domain-containing protein n=1 Tax=Thomasclavelia sp. TaxID=3025757 RepID=UPI0039A2CA1F
MNKHHNIHILFSLSLFLVFVIGSFFIITYEIKGYQNINDVCTKEDNLILPLSYLNTKLKANDSDGACKIVEINNISCLEIKTKKTKTYIYLHEGYLKELYLSNDYQPKLDDGTKLFKIDKFLIEQENDLLKFTIIEGEESKSLSIYLHGGNKNED